MDFSDYSEYRPPPRHSPRIYPEHRRSGQYLNPGAAGGGLYRTRSTGHAPQPVINNIYVDQLQDANLRADSPYHPQPPSPRMAQAPYPAIPVPYPVGAQAPYMQAPYVQAPYAPAPYSPSPDFRGRRLGDDFIEGLAGMALRDGARSRSRGRTEGALQDRPDFATWRLEQKERELEEERKRKLWEKEAELKHMKEEARRDKAESDAEADRKRVIQDYEDKKRRDAQKDKDEEIRYRQKMERDKQEAKDEEQRVKEKLEREAREAKAEEARLQAYYLQKQKDQDEKDKAAKKAEKDKIESEMRKRLAPFGYTESQLDIMVDEEKAKKYKEELSRAPRRPSPGGQIMPWASARSPVYAKVHKRDLSIDTLIYYDIPYEMDHLDANYIIILRDMDKYETEVLFEHTKRLRSGRLLIDAPKKEPQYSWYRKRDRSNSRVRKDKVGILRS